MKTNKNSKTMPQQLESAYRTARKRLQKGCVASEHFLSDAAPGAPDIRISVKVWRFDEELLAKKPWSGGLVAEVQTAKQHEELTRKLQNRLDHIVGIIDAVENRCMAADGPVTPTLKEMDEEELRHIYRLAKGTKR